MVALLYSLTAGTSEIKMLARLQFYHVLVKTPVSDAWNKVADGEA